MEKKTKEMKYITVKLILLFNIQVLINFWCKENQTKEKKYRENENKNMDLKSKNIFTATSNSFH